MTLKEIHAMFTTGSCWRAENTYRPEANGVRNVVKRQTQEICWMNERGQKTWMKLPPASQVVEARDGFLSFKLFKPEECANWNASPDATVSLTRLSPVAA